MGPRMEKGTALGMRLQLRPTPVPSGQHHWASPNPHPWNMVSWSTSTIAPVPRYPVPREGAVRGGPQG